MRRGSNVCFSTSGPGAARPDQRGRWLRGAGSEARKCWGRGRPRSSWRLRRQQSCWLTPPGTPPEKPGCPLGFRSSGLGHHKPKLLVQTETWPGHRPGSQLALSSSRGGAKPCATHRGGFLVSCPDDSGSVEDGEVPPIPLRGFCGHLRCSQPRAAWGCWQRAGASLAVPCEGALSEKPPSAGATVAMIPRVLFL